MKRLLALILSVLMLASMVPAMAATEYDVTEPISITWWHAHEGAYADDMEWMVNKFNTESGMGITVSEDMMIPGIIIGTLGIVACALTYPLYKGIRNARRRKYASRILTLTDKILDSDN